MRVPGHRIEIPDASDLRRRYRNPVGEFYAQDLIYGRKRSGMSDGRVREMVAEMLGR
jgi:hypothetical protein